MSDKARGTETEGQNEDDSEIEVTGSPEGEELAIDPESADQLEPVDRWWDDSEPDPETEPEEGENAGNRRLTEEEAKDAKEVREAKKKVASEKAASTEAEDPDEESDSEGGSEKETPAGKDENEEEDNGPVDLNALIKKTDPVEDLEALFDQPKSAAPDEGLADSDDAVTEEEVKQADVAPKSTDTSSSSDDEASVEEESSGESEEIAEAKVKDDHTDEEPSEVIDLNSEEEKPDGLIDLEASDEPSKESSPATVAKSLVVPVAKPTEEPSLDSIDGDSVKQSDNATSPAPAGNDQPEQGLGEMLATSTQQASVPQKRKGGCWTVFATLFFFATLLVILAIGVAGYIGWSRLGELEAEISKTAQAKLEERGIYVSYQGWEYQFPRGLILNDITVFESQAKEVPLLKASDIGVNVDIIGLIKDRSQVVSAEVSFADSSLTFFEGGEEVASLDSIDSEILASAEAIDVERFTATVGGLNVTASGRVGLSGSDSATEGAAVEEGVGAPALPLDFAAFKELKPWLEIQANGDAPVLDVNFASDGGEEGAISVSANLSGRDFVWRGVSIASVSGSCSYDSLVKSVDVTSLQVGYGDGFVGGVFTVDLDSKKLNITRAQSTVDLVSLLSAYDPKLGENLKSISLADAPMIQLSGMVPLEAPGESALEVVYDHRQGLVYHGEERDLPISDLRGKFNLAGGTLETNDFAAKLLKGTVRINGATRLTAESKPFSGLIEVSELPLTEVASHYGLDDIGMTGDLFFDFRGVGYSDIEKIRGGGNLRIDDAELTAFPVIGPVQELLGKVVPAFGIHGEGSVTGAYIVESGVLITNDLTVSQGGATIVVNGSLNLKSQETKFTATASLESALATATGLGGKQIVVAGVGPVSKPSLVLKDFPIGFASDKLSEVLGTSPETLSQLEGILGGDGNAVEVLGNQLEEATGIELDPAVSDILSGLLKKLPAAEPATPVVPEPPAAMPIRAEPARALPVE